MIDAYIWRTKKYNHIVKIDKGETAISVSLLGPPSLDETFMALSTFVNSKAGESQKAMMRRKGGFIAIFFGSFELAISASSVQSRKYFRISSLINTFVHAWY